MNKAMDWIITPLRRKIDLRIMSIVLCFLLLYLAPFSWLYGADALNIKVASIYAHTGVAADSNIYSIKGVREAVNEINSRGGVLGRKIELIEIDNLSTPIGSKVAAEKAIKQGVIAIIGADWSDHTLPIARVAQANKTPLITNTSTNDGITKIGNYIFRVCYNDSFQGKVMAKFATEDLKAHTAVVFVDLTSEYSMGLSKEFSDHFIRLGGKVTGRIDYTLKQPNFSEQASKAARLHPDVVFIPGYEESALIMKALVNTGSHAIALGGDGWGSEGFFERGGKDITKAYFAGHWSKSIDSEKTRTFLKKYNKGNGVILDPEVLAYDAATLLADALRRAGALEKGKLRDALASTKDFPGVTGRISFSAPLGDPVKSAVIIEIKNGKPMYLKNVLP